MGASVIELMHVQDAYEQIAGDDFDIVHDHTVFGPVYGSQRLNIPIVTTIHGALDVPLTRIYKQSPASLISISEAQCRQSFIQPDRIIHHGLIPTDFTVGKGDGGYALFLGRMAPEKGVEAAIMACLPADVPLLIAAKMREQPEREYFEARIKPHLREGRVEYVGEPKFHEKIDLLQGAKALLFPIQWNEPFGLVMLEALACGTPVLAYRNGAAPEIIMDDVNGFLCDNVIDMAYRLSMVEERVSRRNCRFFLEQRFSAEKMALKHLNLYEELVYT
jgi:glycosyltransferase involved in cell wall biosynthesis